MSWWAAAALGVLAPATAGADRAEPPAFFAALQKADLRVAAVAHRLLTANVALCRARAPQPGIVWQALDQFDDANRPGARAAFGFETPVAVEAVVPGGPAAQAGMGPGDSLVAVAGRPLAFDAPSAGRSVAARNAADRAVAGQPADAALRLTLRRGGRDRSVTLAAQPGCGAAVEMVLGPSWIADADGERLRIGSRFVEGMGDEELAVILAHELAHVVLDHRARLEAAGVDFGMLRELGRNGRLFRRTEDEADALGVALLYNAGYDPGLAARFWRGPGAGIGQGLFRARTHRSASARAALIERAAAAIPPGTPRPYRPPLLATRDQPLD